MNTEQFKEFVDNVVELKLHSYDTKIEVLTYFDGYLNAMRDIGADIDFMDCFNYAVSKIYGNV